MNGSEIPGPVGKTAAQGARSRRHRSEAYQSEAARLEHAQQVASAIIGLRTREDLTQKELAAAIGTSEAAISRLESGRHTPSLRTLSNLAEKFDLEFRLDLRPKTRRTEVEFKISKVLPSSDPLSRWICVVAMARNDALALNRLLIDDQLDEAGNFHVWRFVALHCREFADHLKMSLKIRPVRDFVATLEADAIAQKDKILEITDQRHAAYKAMEDLRNETAHYPVVNINAEAAGQERLARALSELENDDGKISVGRWKGDARYDFADSVLLQMWTQGDDERLAWLMEEARDFVVAWLAFTYSVIEKYFSSRGKLLTIKRSEQGRAGS